jgi:hypothetical protein
MLEDLFERTGIRGRRRISHRIIGGAWHEVTELGATTSTRKMRPDELKRLGL